MDSSLVIAFHGLPPSRAIKNCIVRHMSKLERLYEHLISCRVSVEALHRHHRTGNVCNVHIEMHVPGRTLVVTRDPHHPKQRFARASVQGSVREAFEAAATQLKEFKALQRGETKIHLERIPGQIANIYPERDYGFILTNEGKFLYFHRNSLIQCELGKLKRGDVVHFVEMDGDTGATAGKVWLGADFRLD